MSRPCLPPPPNARHQRGAALVMVMLLLLVMTLLGLASLRTTQMEERMSGNLLDRSLAFQAAEAALREAEIAAAARPAPAGTGCVAGLCGTGDLESDSKPWESTTVWASAPQAQVDLAGLVDRPRYIIELIATGIPPRGSCTTSEDVSSTGCTGSEVRYRLTARSTQTGRAAVTLQSIFAL
ncbi:MAG: pilus assembly protein [Chiayiivirga sp.]|jgi:type IV pilus assembly protein PilX|uniref:pilus assembly PilX family protein n=1 Tax=Chiayiivirga sp. TaxID=2041042 RepID=UPI0025C22CD5|nr:PilX N-terminal domain-containing pilus assembly protein [Chiayiivirga sp.]MCI1730704.1 pilus assembly protein [Chiayiivirga sp.]